MNEGDQSAVIIGGLSLGEIAQILVDRRSKPEDLARFIAAEADWTFYASRSSWAFAGKMNDRDAILRQMKAFRAEFEQKFFDIRDILVCGEQVSLRYRAIFRHHGTGRQAEIAGLAFIRAEGDCVVEGHEFCDSAQLLQLRNSSRF